MNRCGPTPWLAAAGLLLAACASDPWRAPSSASVIAEARALDADEPSRLRPGQPRRTGDTNHDGALDPTEWLAWEWAGVLDRDDRNHDGLISEAEWLSEYCEFQSPSIDGCVKTFGRRFRRLDRSRDGRLTPLEWSPVSMGWFVQNDRNRDCRIEPPEGERSGERRGPTWPCSPRPAR